MIIPRTIYKDYFELVEFEGELYPVVKRLKGKLEIDECPYCGKSHSHGSGIEDSPQNSHCLAIDLIHTISIRGLIIPHTRGYIIKDYLAK